ncbi:MAG: DUF3604 domain-containing protein [Armatimonadota bacterium]
MTPTGMQCVVPSRLGVGETFSVKVRVLGEIRTLEPHGAWNTWKPRLHGPFNLNVQRNIPYQDNCLPAWTGALRVDGGAALAGPERIVFDGERQGVFPGDTRPIGVFDGFCWTRPGLHFLRLIDEASDVEAWANAVYVTEEAPAERIFWGDPHWQTYFSDGVRCPEELYAFARDEAFLDFGAITDHMEAVTDRQWDYFTAVTNDFNEAGRFATLVGQEWTKHNPGHRNVYVRGDAAPPLRCTDPDCDTLEKLWTKIAGLDAIAIPHHSANVIMGVDWSQGWNPQYETAVEIYSVWGSSERHADDGNTRPIHHCNGEMRGRHVIDALNAGFRFGFVGGGDIHDGRPGDYLLRHIPQYAEAHPQGFTAALAPALTRDGVYDAMRTRRTYATTQRRIYLETSVAGSRLSVRAASEDGIAEVVVIRNGVDAAALLPEADPRIVEAAVPLDDLAPDEYCYLRVVTRTGDMAWSSPVWGDEVK